MGSWYLSLVVSLFLIMIGLYMHWTVMAAGLILPFIPIISLLVQRRRARKERAVKEKERPKSRPEP
ncbi:MAG: hypothetical protein OEU86_04545 [Gammaproteobacteria bacterium]|nr:hypothetical protein [Gammaproteobacteria bacterium]